MQVADATTWQACWAISNRLYEAEGNAGIPALRRKACRCLTTSWLNHAHRASPRDRLRDGFPDLRTQGAAVMDQRRKIWTLFKAAPTPLPFSRALRAGLCALLLCLPIVSQAKPHPLLPGASASTPGTCAITTLSGWQWWGLAALLLQTAAIGVLLVDRRHRLSAEREAGRRLSELAQHNHAASLGELSAAIAHELNQPLGAMLTNAEAALLMLESEPPRIEEAREALRDIARDNG